MKQREGSTRAAVRRAREFLDANGVRFASVNQSSARRALDDAETQLDAHASDQAGGARGSKGETARQQALRQTLRRQHMRPIATAAQLRLREVPEFASLTLPAPRVSVDGLILAAGSMAEAAQKHEQVLIDTGLPDDFIAQLDAAAAALKGSIGIRDASTGRRQGATAALSTQEKRGRAVLKIIDARLMPLIGTDDDLRAKWEAAKRPQSKPGPAAGSTTPSVTTPATPATTTAPEVPTPHAA